MVWLLLALLAGPARAADCEGEHDPWDTGLEEADCDGDGYTQARGDCNDFDDTVYPGARELCEDYEDNNCDGYYNEGCDNSLSRGSLVGGSSCGGGLAGLFLSPLLLLLMRRRR